MLNMERKYDLKIDIVYQYTYLVFSGVDKRCTTCENKKQLRKHQILNTITW